MKIILNPAPAQKIDPRYLAMIDILIPNETEAEVLTNITLSSKEKAIDAGRYIVSQGVDSVIITMGANGAIFVSKERQID